MQDSPTKGEANGNILYMYSDYGQEYVLMRDVDLPSGNQQLKHAAHTRLAA